MSTQLIYKTVKSVIKDRFGPKFPPSIAHLDIGAGQGELIQLLGLDLPVHSFACDFHIERFGLKSVPIAQVNLNSGRLPYEDETFDLVTCSEVIEHVENYRAVLREVNRVLKRNGLLVLTTPNVLNMSSRIRYLTAGFANLFGPLPVKNNELYTTGGHIMPIPFFYLAHALLDAEFKDIRLTVDKFQKTSIFLLPLGLPFLLLGWIRFLSRERKRYRTITPENEAYVLAHRSKKILFGRTIVVSVVK